MKNFILLLVVFASFSLFAQNDVVSSDNEWMTKISSDSEMRVKMMDLIVEKTKGNEEEMRKIVNSISNNPELYQLIVETFPRRANGENISVEPLGISKDNMKIGIMVETKPVPKPKQ